MLHRLRWVVLHALDEKNEASGCGVGTTRRAGHNDISSNGRPLYVVRVDAGDTGLVWCFGHEFDCTGGK
jgi:hypothetical protein